MGARPDRVEQHLPVLKYVTTYARQRVPWNAEDPVRAARAPRSVRIRVHDDERVAVRQPSPVVLVAVPPDAIRLRAPVHVTVGLVAPPRPLAVLRGKWVAVDMRAAPMAQAVAPADVRTVAVGD